MSAELGYVWPDKVIRVKNIRLALNPATKPLCECRPTGPRRSEGLLLEPESIPVSELTSCGLLEPESILVSEFTSYGAPPRARIYSLLVTSRRETHRIQGLVYLFTLQGSGQAPLWYTPEKITVPKAWFTGSTCLALASSLEYILEVFLLLFSFFSESSWVSATRDFTESRVL
ncbi:hypothetical protein EVAR_100910_1 [Eumeta japonica]|uniref:Uncharacterized protein n=1 Tax=Eumeta variegata TaxID=151549 RepID=A0A4C1SSA8_EUMVA|nr:hypothetical protein EVAR_100910_1 [Eumeta japonica]